MGYATHGLAKHPLYKTWWNMVHRCTDPKHNRWRSHGGRGITVCERWMDITNFIADVGVRPEGMTLDRIDNDKGYYPENCRWADIVTQNRNRRVVGVHFTQKSGRWRAAIGIGGKQKYLGEFDTREEALAVRERAKVELWQTIQKVN